MIIQCPKCHEKYDIYIKDFPKEGRMLRCSKCSHRFHQHHPDHPLTTFETDKLTISAPPVNSIKVPKAVTWSIILMIILVTVTSLYWARFMIVAAFPAVRPLYEALGVVSADTPVTVLDIQKTTAMVKRKPSKEYAIHVFLDIKNTAPMAVFLKSLSLKAHVKENPLDPKSRTVSWALKGNPCFFLPYQQKALEVVVETGTLVPQGIDVVDMA